MLAILRTNVLMTFFEISIYSSYNNTTTINKTTMAQWLNLSITYIFKVFFILSLLLIVIIMFHSLYVVISWFIHHIDFNNYPAVVFCCCCNCFFYFCAASNLQNHIVLYSTVSMHDSFIMVFGTVTVGRKFENHVCSLCGPQVYRYPIF